MRIGVFTLVVLGFASGLMLPSQAKALNFTKITYSNDPARAVDDNFACNANGDILIDMKDQSLKGPLQLIVHGSVPITVVGSNYSQAIQGPVSLTNGRDVTFQSFDPSSPSTHGAFRRTGGGQLITLTGAPFGKAEGAPSPNANGDVVFLSMSATGAPEVKVRTTGGFIGNVASGGFAGRFGRPAINTALNVVTSGQFSNGRDGLAVARIGGGEPLTINGDWRLTTSQPKITENNKILFTVERDPPQGQATGQRQHLLAVPDPTSGAYSVQTIGNIENDCIAYMNESLTVACVDGRKYGMYFADQGASSGAEATWTYLPLLNIGDAFDGSTLTSITLGDGSVQPDNSVIFHATLANGASGIYQVVVPEPVSLGLLGMGSVLLRRRR